MKMFIRKKVYEEKMDLLNGYIQRCERKNDQICQLTTERNNLKELHNLLEKRVNTLENLNENLITENKKLIEWIEKIINEVGCYTVPDGNHVTIPVYKNKCEPAYYGQAYNPFISESVVTVIPEIKIVKMS
jgi:hypothetical protein